MPLYFFDFQDRAGVVRDDEGTELATDAAARCEAVETLYQLAKGKLVDDEGQSFIVRVRDLFGSAVYLGQLTFKGEWARPAQDG